jgi:sulfur relay (sulfurtransferase) DsrC/TusE family protein
MDIYNNVKSATCLPDKDIVYPFNLDKYIDLTFTKTVEYYRRFYKEHCIKDAIENLIKVLEQERQIYIDTARELMTRYEAGSTWFMITNQNKEFRKMSKYAIDNFIYILNIRGWNADVKYGVYKDDRIYPDVESEYYASFKISPMFIAKI